jgi:hypothetical protein
LRLPVTDCQKSKGLLRRSNNTSPASLWTTTRTETGRRCFVARSYSVRGVRSRMPASLS